MKRAGIILLIIGLVLTLITGFNYMTKEKIVDIGDIEISADKSNRVDWSPMVGIAVMVIGGVVYLVGTRK